MGAGARGTGGKETGAGAGGQSVRGVNWVTRDATHVVDDVRATSCMARMPTRKRAYRWLVRSNVGKQHEMGRRG